MKSFYVTNNRISWHRLLRRTLVRSEQCASGEALYYRYNETLSQRYRRMIAANYYGCCHPDEGLYYSYNEPLSQRYRRMIAADYYGCCHPDTSFVSTGCGGICGKQLQKTYYQYDRLHWSFKLQSKDPSTSTGLWPPSPKEKESGNKSNCGMTSQSLCNSSSCLCLTNDYSKSYSINADDKLILFFNNCSIAGPPSPLERDKRVRSDYCR